MKPAGPLRKPLARFLVGLLLFTLLAPFAQACMLSQAGAPHPVVAAFANHDGVSPREKPVCTEHCLQVYGAGHALNSQLPPITPLAAAVEAPAPSWLARASIRATPVRDPASGPGLQILFCSFQT